MQLDQYRIVVRERGLLELLDLALRVMHTHAGPLAAAWIAGALPAAAFNAWLLGGFAAGGLDGSPPFGYLFLMTVMIVWELPLAAAPMTLLLGQALFDARPRAAQIASDLLRALPQLLLFQVLLRGLLTWLFAPWFVLFASWPYLGEVILLERNPVRATAGRPMTTYRRANLLHGGFVGDLFGRWLGATAAALAMFAAIWLSLWMLAGVLAAEWDFSGAVYTVFFPLAAWATAGCFAVVRFLGYLDLRIRREGWEVELLMRAEGARLTRQPV